MVRSQASKSANGAAADMCACCLVVQVALDVSPDRKMVLAYAHLVTKAIG